MADLYLQHHGVLGQKWGVRRYQNYDGTRIKDSDSYTLKKGTEFTRYSPNKSDLKNGVYISQSKWDKDMYMHDAFTNALGFKKAKEKGHDIFQVSIKNIKPVTIRNGKAMCNDILKEHGNKTLNEYYKHLESKGYLDESKSALDRWNIIKDNKSDLKKRAKLGTFFNQHVYKKDRDKFVKKYKDLGYDAVKDPEDFMWNYETPMIVTDSSKFKVKSNRKLNSEDKKRIMKKFGAEIK